MHENIKFTVRLSDKIKPLSDPAHLKLEKDDINEEIKFSIADWQSVFSDVKYGTHFFVYGKFIGSKVAEGFKISKIQLYLQNYTGSVTIGFDGAPRFKKSIIFEGDASSDEPENPDVDKLRYPDRTKYLLSLRLRGLNTNNLVENVSDFPNDLIIKDGDILETQINFNPVDPQLSRIYDSAEVMRDTPFVDELFMERVGEDVVVSESGIKGLLKLGLFNDAASLVERGVTATTTENSKVVIKEDVPKGISFACKPVNTIFHFD